VRAFRPLRLFLVVGALSFFTGAVWTTAEFQRGIGYWSWNVTWWELAALGGVVVAGGVAVGGGRARRLAVPVGVFAGLSGATGGFATLFVYLMIYGTGT
jgi:hypothetical protein